MKTITFNISDAKFIEHKERVIRLRQGDYQGFLWGLRLDDYKNYLADNDLQDYQKYLDDNDPDDYKNYLEDNDLDNTDANKNEYLVANDLYDYQKYIADNDLDNSNANQNEYFRLFLMHPAKNLLKRLEKEDEVQKSQVDISKSDLT